MRNGHTHRLTGLADRRQSRCCTGAYVGPQGQGDPGGQCQQPLARHGDGSDRARADARLDVMLFERIRAGAWGNQEEEEDWEAGGLDPSSLLGVVEALTKLTGGLPIDPASGTIMP